MSPQPRSSFTTPLEIVALGAVWGASFLFMRVAAPAFGEFALVDVRLVLGTLVLLPLLWRDRAAFTPALWPKLALIGAINSAIPFALFAWAARHAPAGVGAISNSMAVVFSALIAALFYGERITARRALGLALGLAGVVVLASGRTAGNDLLLPALAGTFAALLYGIGGNLVKRQLAGLPPGATAAATLGCGALLTAPLALSHWPATPIPAAAWLCAALLGVVCTGLAYLVFYRLIQRIGAPRASTTTYLVPLFGVLWAWTLLGEQPTGGMAIACALILAGVALSQHAAPAPAATPAADAALAGERGEPAAR